MHLVRSRIFGAGGLDTARSKASIVRGRVVSTPLLFLQKTKVIERRQSINTPR